MTDRQLKAFYFPLWNKAAWANTWVMVKGKLHPDAQRAAHGLEEVNALYQKIWAAAEALAQHAHRAVIVDDLRHACHLVALSPKSAGSLQAVVSSKDLTNRQLDRVAALFKLLIDPNDIDAWLNWENPEKADKARLVHSIRNAAPFAYIDQICKRKFGPRYESPFYEDLPLQDLLNLRRTLSQRTQHGHRPIGANNQSSMNPKPNMQPDADTVPF